METASAKQELLLSKLVLEKQVFAVLIYICVWFEGFLFCRFAVLCVIRFIWAGGMLPRDPPNKSGEGPFGAGLSGTCSILWMFSP